MKNTYNSLHLNYDRILAEANDLEAKLKESEETQKLLKVWLLILILRFIYQ